MLRFEQTEYDVSETQGSVTVQIILNLPSATAVNFLLKAKDITATSENLYCNNMTLLFADTV